jgi:hypothetical protein
MMDPLYATWPTGLPLPTRDRPERRLVDAMDAFSFGQPARGVHALQQEWAPALDLFDVDRPDDAPSALQALAKLIGLVVCLTAVAGVLISTVGRALVGLLTGSPGS